MKKKIKPEYFRIDGLKKL